MHTYAHMRTHTRARARTHARTRTSSFCQALADDFHKNTLQKLTINNTSKVAMQERAHFLARIAELESENEQLQNQKDAVEVELQSCRDRAVITVITVIALVSASALCRGTLVSL